MLVVSRCHCHGRNLFSVLLALACQTSFATGDSRASLAQKRYSIISFFLDDLCAARCKYSHKANRTITTLNLSLNSIGADGARALSDALKATFASCFWL